MPSAVRRDALRAERNLRETRSVEVGNNDIGARKTGVLVDEEMGPLKVGVVGKDNAGREGGRVGVGVEGLKELSRL